MNKIQSYREYQKRYLHAKDWKITRRDFLVASGLLMTKICTGNALGALDEPDSPVKLRFGIVTDAHYADSHDRGTRYYRESLDKLTECVEQMNEMQVDFLIQLGDFKDQDEPPTEESTLRYLKTIESVYRQFKGPRYHVLGNHDMDSISKEQFLAGIENTGITSGRGYYSFDLKGVHLVVLDANYTAEGDDYDRGHFAWTDANIPQEELEWLQGDLASTSLPVIVFIHQQLDGEGNHTVRNAEEVRQCLQSCQRVLAVFQGHNHAGHYSRIEDIHYYTLKAMVEGSGKENNSFAIVEVDDHLNMVVTGYHQAVSRNMMRTE